MDTLLPEDLLLLLLDDTTGRLAHAGYLDTGIGGGLLVELALAGHVEVVRGSGIWAGAKVRPAGGERPSDPVLGEALDLVATRERSAKDLVGRLGKHRREQLLERLASRGVLRREQDRVLGLFPRDRWPAADSSHETDVRRRLADVLLRGADPDERTAALVALLSAMDLAHKVLDREGLSSREVRRRAREVAEGDWAAQAVKDAIAAAQAAVAAATVAATTAATTSATT